MTGSPEPSARAGTPDSGPFPTGAVLQKLERPGLLSVSGLRGSAPAFSLAAAIARTQGPLLWIVPNRRSLEQRLGELRTFLGGSRPVLAYPDWEVEPYRGYSPDASKLHRQIAALTALAGEEPAVVVAEAAALLRRVLPLARLRERIESVEVACSLDRDALVRRLVERGYLVTEQCTEAGNLSVRGGVLDVFSPAHSLPLRIEFWGDEVESLRTFDPYTQRSVETLQSCRLAPVRELQLDTEATQLLPEQLKRLSDASGLSPRARKAIEEELLELRVLQEVELYLPLFEPRLDSVLTYLPDAGWVVVDGPEAIAAQLYGRRQTFTEAWEREGCADRLIPPPEALFLESPEFLEAVYDRRGVLLEDLGEAEDAEGALRISAPDHGDLRAEILAARSTSAKMLQPLLGRLEAWREAGAKVVLASPSLRQGDRLGALLEPHGLSLPRLPDGALAEAARTGSTAEFPSLSWSPGELRRGFCWIDRGLVVVAAEELLGRKSRSKASRRRAGLPPIGSLAQLRRDDCVVHNLHGIGRYLGLQRLDLGANALEVAADRKGRARDASYKPGTVAPLRVGGRSTAAVPDARGQDPVSGRTAPSSIPTAAAPANDYLVLEYKGGDRLFLPVHKLNLLSRYVSPGRAKPRLDKLGGTTWRKRRKKVSEEVQKIAKELVELYARRSLARTVAYPPPDSYYREFAEAFPYEETPDQQAAIDTVLEDLEKDRPMDRLVCGDVGFGKTEVAMRAAFRAVEAGRQVAVLVPTTVLALQHCQAFQERFAAFPVEIAMLSRFRTPKQQQETLDGLAMGRVDIVVGTHRLLSRDLRFKKLGLLVVDEEHRFGVSHKERLKEMRANVHALTLSATPIPRTLHMALSGLRDFSVIATAPEGRSAVRTSVARFSPHRVQDAIRRELARGGQVFFLHNRVQTIQAMAEFLKKLVPEAELRVGHGQMSERALENIMIDFFEKRFDVLVCTTIVESGLDVPSANTMIINRADTLGLAQLHQLRGRVGRSHTEAFCLLLVPPGRALRSTAVERVKVVQSHSELGSGHRIAQHDLEIRGAGNLLGRKQSGHIADVGMAAYMELLEAAVAGLQGKEVDTGPEPDVDLKSGAYLPAELIEDEAERLLEYKRLADARTPEELRDLLDDLADRYGALPEPVSRFEGLCEVKALCRRLRIVELRSLRGGRIHLRFDPTTAVEPAALLVWSEDQSCSFSFRSEGLVELGLAADERAKPLESIRLLLRGIVQRCLSRP